MMQVLKINSVTYEIKWNYQYFDQTAATASVTDTTLKYKLRNKPNFIYQDPNDRSRAYLIGQTTQLGTIIKFAKRNMAVDYRMEIIDPDGAVAPQSPINEITAYKQVASHIYACGYSYDTPNDADTPAVAPALPKDTRSASIFQMETSGRVNTLYNFGSYKSSTSTQHDACRGVTYDVVNDQVVYILEATSPSLRPDYRKWEQFSKNDKTITLIMMRPGGRLDASYNINNAGAAISYEIGNNAIGTIGQDLFWGARSYGFKTLYQNRTFNLDTNVVPLTDQMDSHLFKYNPRGASKDCFNNGELS